MPILTFGSHGTLVRALAEAAGERGEALSRVAPVGEPARPSRGGPDLPCVSQDDSDCILHTALPGAVLIVGAAERDAGMGEEEAASLLSIGMAALDVARDLSGRGVLRAAVLVSTAYLQGSSPGTPFERAYDALEACFADARRGGMPVAIVRPSIIVRPIAAIRDEARERLEMGLRVFRSGFLPWLPGAADTLVDLVPADLAARAILHLAERPDADRHTLAAGAARASRLGEILDLVAERVGTKPPRLVAAGRFLQLAGPLIGTLGGARGRELLQRGKAYLPYLARRDPFEIGAGTAATLADRGIEAPFVRDYVIEALDALGA